MKTTENKPVLGIDLGTYNSDATVCINGQMTLIRNGREQKEDSEGTKEFPSFISFFENGEIKAVGIDAKEEFKHSNRVIFGLKRLLSKNYSELKKQGELDRYPFTILPDKKTGECTIVVGQKTYSPQELLSHLLKHIKSKAEEQMDFEFEEVVISVPAYFSAERVNCITETARMSGFKKINTIPEPVAASLVYDNSFDHETKTLCIDLGAGTLDVTVGMIQNPIDGTYTFETLANCGDSKLGGIDIDLEIKDCIIKFLGKNPETISKEKLQSILKLSERIKIDLSTYPEVQTVFMFDEEKKVFNYSQQQLEVACQEIINKVKYQIEYAIRQAGWEQNHIDKLIIIGGPMKLHFWKEMFQNIFRDNTDIKKQLDEFYVSENIDRMHAVSMGAALSRFKNNIDRIPMGYGIEITTVENNHLVYKPVSLIKRNSIYPCNGMHLFRSWDLSDSGDYHIKLLEHIPDSELGSFEGKEWKLVDKLAFKVKHGFMADVVAKININEHKEISVSITNASYEDEQVQYNGIIRSTDIPMDYPVFRKIERSWSDYMVEKVDPKEETVEDFCNWITELHLILTTKVFHQNKIKDTCFNGIQNTLKKLEEQLEDGQKNLHQIFNCASSLIHNSFSNGLITEKSHQTFKSILQDYDEGLFRQKVIKTKN